MITIVLHLVVSPVTDHLAAYTVAEVQVLLRICK